MISNETESVESSVFAEIRSTNNGRAVSDLAGFVAERGGAPARSLSSAVIDRPSNVNYFPSGTQKRRFLTKSGRFAVHIMSQTWRNSSPIVAVSQIKE